jgi:pilus assembly protein Flp/PilA
VRRPWNAGKSRGDAAVNGVLKKLLNLLRSEDGPTATEYAVLLALIALGVIGALALFGDHMNNLYTLINATLDVF